MATRPPLSVVIITLNEEHNLSRALGSLTWCEEVLVVDSGSTDKTKDIALSFGARVLENPWRGYGQQKNWAAENARYDWVFYVDADEEIPQDLRQEIEGFLEHQAGHDCWGASMPRRTFYLGRWILYGGWYPNRLTRLAHRKHSRWSEPALHESLEVRTGSIFKLRCDLLHYTFRDVGDQIKTNLKFAKLGAKVAKDRGETGSIWRILSKPIGKFLETYVWKLGFLDGFPGFVISVNAAHSIFLKYVELRLEKDFTDR